METSSRLVGSMETPRALVLRAPGTNCDLETAYALELAGASTTLLHVGRLADGAVSLRDFQIFVVPGGFSYGDDLGSAKVFANEIELRLHDELAAFVDRGGLVLGICNGFQVLVRAGLLPRPSAGQRVSLLPNESGRFECRWIHMRVADGNPCIFTRGIERLELAVAHGEGKLLVPPGAEGDIVPVLHYTDPDGRRAGYPHNPNGSYMDIAGLTDPSGHIFGLMPHPERFVRSSQHPGWTASQEASGVGQGLEIFLNAVRYARGLA